MRSRQNRESLINQQADDFLNQLRGYHRRQEWGKVDKEFVVGVLTEWDDYATDLTNQIKALQQRVHEAESLNRSYERRLIGTGFGHYFKFLIGAEKCPSR